MKFSVIANRILENDNIVSQEYWDKEDREEQEDEHLIRVYNAVKDGEWTFDDFKDFVSVVRNEAKIAAEE